MHHHFETLHELPWIAGWLVAMAVVFWFAIRLPLQIRAPRVVTWLYGGVVLVGFAAVLLLANAALNVHHVHFDLTREQTFTPSEKALDVVRQLKQPVRLSYFYRADDERGLRAQKIIELMGRTNALLNVETADPNKDPELARKRGAKSFNTAVIEAEGRRVVVRSVDETEIALGIQRVLRQHVVNVCFMEGHGEFPSDNYSFHTHVEGLAGHEHDSSASAVIRAGSHGIGRLRRALESVGYQSRKITPATSRGIPDDCRVLIAASPQTTFLPGESAALKTYLERGGALLAMFDLGFVLEPGLDSLMRKLGVRLPQAAIVDQKSHYATNAETVAVTGYDKHPITRSVSFTFYPGVRPLILGKPAAGVRVVPLIVSSDASTLRPVAPIAAREVVSDAAAAPLPADIAGRGSHVLAAAAEGVLPDGGRKPFRAVVIGDGDFASNSFFPFMSNSSLAISMVRWLAGEEGEAQVTTQVRVPPLILLTNVQMRVVFTLLVVLLPLSVVALGGFVWWLRR